MREIINLNYVFFPILCAAFNFLNLLFLIAFMFINKNKKQEDKYLNFHSSKEIKFYILFSFGSFVYIMGQVILVVFNNFAVNLFFHRLQHAGVMLATIGYINILFLTFNIKSKHSVLQRISSALLLVAIPLIMFSNKFIIPVSNIYAGMLQGKEGILYWICIGYMGLLVISGIILSFIQAKKKIKNKQPLQKKEKYFLVASGALLVFIIIEFLAIIGVIPEILTHYMGISLGLTTISFSIAIQITQEFSQAIKNMYSTQQETLDMKKNIEKEYHDLLITIVDILERDDEYTAGHSRRVMKYSGELAKALGLSQHNIKKIQTAGILHDIGKVGVSKLVLNKPGTLLPIEFEEIKKHPQLGFDILSVFEPYSEIALYVKYHHEKLNGKGYPDGINKNKIPYFTKIITVVDIFDALHSKRPYRGALSDEKCIAIMDRMATNGEIDKHLLKKFVRIVPVIKNK